MKNEERKNLIDKLYRQIRLCEEIIDAFTESCKHEKTFVGNYSYRVGATHLAEICEYCHKAIKVNL